VTLMTDTVLALGRLDRAQNLSTPATKGPRRGIAWGAETISRRAMLSSMTALLQAALTDVTTLAYEREGRFWLNVDRNTGRLLVPAPWGRAGHAQWGLRRREGETLRHILFDRMKQTSALWLYDELSRSWYLNLSRYRNLSQAQTYLSAVPLVAKEVASALAERVPRG